MDSNIKKSKLYTKTGDAGLTSLYNGTREYKDSIYFSCLGDLDELNCNLGMVKAFFKSEMEKQDIKLYNAPGAGGMFYKDQKCIDSGKYYEWFALEKYITEIQCNIMDISSLIATPPINTNTDIEMWLSRVGLHNFIVKSIELNIDRLDSLLPPIKNFVLPSGNQLLSQIHICRAVSRRCERNYLSVENKLKFIPHGLSVRNILENKIIEEQYSIVRIYLNRLSDYFFALSRFIGMTLNLQEDLYSKNKIVS
jgi:cob(I)alamin adenosyltransferase